MQELSRIAECYVTAHPNAGLPNAFGEYDLDAGPMAAQIREWAEAGFLNIVGGCCGTTPEHIAAMSRAVEGLPPRQLPDLPVACRLAGLEPLNIGDASLFVNVGERTNVTGSAKFKRLIKEEKYSEALDVARQQVENGAQIIDINMGCPAKKVCNAWAGSALMRDEDLVARILSAVVAAVDVPVTLKIRTGWDCDHRNGPRIAHIAEDSGIAALAVHGRTRDQHYTGQAEYETIAAIKAALRIPVLANGDIDSPQKAAHVLAVTGVDAVMIGRAAQGRPWIFREVAHYLATGTLLAPPSLQEVRDILLGHLHALHDFYGEPQGVRIARKHLGWYAKDRPENAAFRAVVNRADDAASQIALTTDYFNALAAGVPLSSAA